MKEIVILSQALRQAKKGGLFRDDNEYLKSLCLYGAL